MNIKNKLYISAGISIILVIILISLVLVTSDRLTESHKQHEIFLNVSKGIAELDLVTYDYLLHREKRMERQWHSKYNSLKEILDEASGEQKMISVRADYVILGNLFSQVTENNKEIQKLIQEGASQERIDAATRLEERIVAQLLVLSHSIITDASGLSEQKHAEEIEATRLASNLTIILVTILVIAVITSSLLVARSISKPLIRLANYSRRVGEGEYGADLEIKGKDEIASVARDVKTMVGQLRKHREHLEELVEERTSRLTVVNKELEAFSYSVSHDLRAPLRAIDGFSNLLLEKYRSSLDEKGDHYLKRIRNGAQNMAQLIDSLLKLSRIGRSPISKKKIDIGGIASGTFKALEDEYKDRKVNFTVQKCKPALADPDLIKIVFTNLLSNAFKSTRDLEVAEITVGCEKKNGKAAYFVKDNGIGFDVRYSNKLFIPFQRLHSEIEFEGTGIGLAIVQRIINMHNGKVWAEGKVGEGATFYFRL